MAHSVSLMTLPKNSSLFQWINATGGQITLFVSSVWIIIFKSLIKKTTITTTKKNAHAKLHFSGGQCYPNLMRRYFSNSVRSIYSLLRLWGANIHLPEAVKLLYAVVCLIRSWLRNSLEHNSLKKANFFFLHFSGLNKRDIKCNLWTELGLLFTTVSGIYVKLTFSRLQFHIEWTDMRAASFSFNFKQKSIKQFFLKNFNIKEIMKELVLHLDVKSRLDDIPPFLAAFLFFLSLSRYILLMIPFLCVILRLRLVSLPPASYLPFHPSSFLCIDSLYSLYVY